MDRVTQILVCAPPPEAPYAIDFTWQDVERHLGVEMPNDFKQLVLCYGRGVFEPSGVRLCNYLESRSFAVMDQMIDRARSDPASSEGVPYPFSPEPDGLLPLASYQDEDHFFFLNLRHNPPSIVWIRNIGHSSEEFHGLSVSDMLWRAFHDPRSSIRSVAEFLEETSGDPPEQQFCIERHEVLVDPAICRPIARGGRRVSYRIQNSLELTISEELELQRARREHRSSPTVHVDWGWWSRHADRTLAPECSFRLEVLPRDSNKTPEAHCDELYNDYYSDSPRRERRVLTTPTGPVSQVLATSGRHKDVSIAFLGELDALHWRLWVMVQEEHLAPFLDEAELVVQSVRAVNKSH